MKTNTETNSIPWRVTESAFSRGSNGELHIGTGERTHAVVYFDPANKAERAQAMRDATLFSASPDLLACVEEAQTELALFAALLNEQWVEAKEGGSFRKEIESTLLHLGQKQKRLAAAITKATP
jgi:hypothetical protein